MRSVILGVISLGVVFGMGSIAGAQTPPAPAQLASAVEPAIRPHVEITNFSSPAVFRNSIASVTTQHEKRMNRIWIASIFAMAAASGADAATSWGKREGNGFLASSDGTFGAKGLSIKAGLAAGVIVPQILLRKHSDLKKIFSIGNFAQAAVFTGIAAHNAGVPSR